MFAGIDHVGIAVTDGDAGVATYTRLIGRGPVHRERVDRDGVEAVMFEAGDSFIELLIPTRGDSAISRFLATRGDGLHHIAYRVDDVQAVLDEQRAAGARLLDTCPRSGANRRMVAFMHPSAAMGVLTELCMSAVETGPTPESR